MVAKSFGAFRAGKDAQIGNAGGLHAVEFALQALHVAAAAVGGQYRAIPEVGAGEAVDAVAAVKLPVVAHSDVGRCRGSGDCHSHDE